MQEMQAIWSEHSWQSWRFLTHHQAFHASKLDQHHQKRHGHPRNCGQTQKRSHSQRSPSNSGGKPFKFAPMLACQSNSQLCLAMVCVVCGVPLHWTCLSKGLFQSSPWSTWRNWHRRSLSLDTMCRKIVDIQRQEAGYILDLPKWPCHVDLLRTAPWQNAI